MHDIAGGVAFGMEYPDWDYHMHGDDEFLPLEQLAISPQCGFASTQEGNKLSEEQQWAKLRLCAELAEEIWGR